MKHIIRLFILIAALVLGTNHAWADAESNPRVKFVYVDENGSALSNVPGSAIASAADANRQVAITVTINDGQDYRCIEGDLTAEQSINSGNAEARTRTSGEGLGKGVPVPVTCTKTNEFTLTLPEDESTNVTVYVKFSEKDSFTPVVSIENWTYGHEANTPTITGNESGGAVTYTYSFKDGDVTHFLDEMTNASAGTYFVKATVAATADYKECESEPVAFTIDKAQLTVTANNHSILYGNAAANDGVTYSSFVNGEDENDLGGELTYTYSNGNGNYGEGNDAPGEYDIIPDGLTSDNYAITFVPGKLTVTPVEVRVSVVDVANGEEIEGATVQVLDGENVVKDLEGNNVEWTSGKETHTINVLKAGKTYTLRETVAPDGYTIPADYTFTIDETGTVTTTNGTMTQEGVLLVENTKTHVEVSVVDIDNGEEIEGATIQVIDPDNKVVEEWTSTKNNYVIEGLKTGEEYTLRETVAPNRYAAPADYTFTIDVDGKVTTSGSSTTDEEGYTVLLVENTKTGDLTVKNTLISDLASDANQEFEFTVTATFGDQPISGTYGDMTFTEGKTTFTLKGGQEKTAANLLYGTTYTVTQVEAEGFTLEKTGDTGTIEQESSTAEFTNTRETGDLTVKNTLISDLASDAYQEFTFTVSLPDNATLSGTYGDMTFDNGVATFTLTGQTDNNSKTAKGLPTTLSYTVTQEDAEGFTLDKTGDEGTISTASTLAVFTNTRETGNLKVTNTVYPSSDDTDFVFTVTLTNAPVTDTYGDMSFSEGVATVTLKGGESAEATSLPTTVEYTVTQTANDDFSTTKTGDTGTISATQSVAAFKNIKLIEARFDIDWHDGGNTSSRPEGLTTELLSKLTTDEGEPQPVPEQGAITLNEGNNWHARITNLPVYNVDGLEIAYSWREIESVPSDYLLTDHSTGIDASYTYTLKTSATVTISWDDADDQDGIRPTEMSARLSNGTDATLNSANSWTATVEDLPKYDNNDIAIDYNWTPGALPDDYTMSDLSKADIVTTITLSHTLEKTQVSVNANWDDTGNKEGFRPTSVTVKLLADGNEANSVTLNADNEWNYTWTGLDKYANGTEITYTVSQTQLANYEVPAIAKTSETGWAYSVTNSRDYEETEVKVSKVWDDNENEEGFRTASVTVRLKKGNTEIESVELEASPDPDYNWTHTWSGLQKYENGTAINYTVTEDPVANYSTQITKATDGTFTYTVTNSRSVEKTEVSVQVVWDDKNNEMGFRPESVTVKLLVNGAEDNTATLNLASEWKYTWTELNKFANGQEIEYTISQDQVNGYMSPTIAKDSESAFSYTVTNSIISISGVTITKDGNGITATLNGASDESFSITGDINIDHVKLDRKFESGKKVAICWPFAVDNTKAASLGKFYQFAGISTEGKITMQEVTGGLEANTPYIFEPSADITTIIDFGENTLKAGGPLSVGSGFTFKGIYDRVKWTTDESDPLYDATRAAELGKAYGFALEEITVGSTTYLKGQFVKLGSGAHSRPFRAYMLYDGDWDGNQPSASARYHSEAQSLPDVIDIVWISANGEGTSIEDINCETTNNSDWYSLDGRKLNGKPTVKGLYINNGRKVVVQ